MKRLGMVGAGAIAQAYLKALDGDDCAQIVGVVDVRPEAAQAAAEIARCKAFGSYREMADSAQLDAAIICTPPASHPEIAKFFLSRGINVLCEKPIAIDIDSAQTIAAAGQASGSLVTMASKFRYVEDVIRLKSIVASGLLGDILLMENGFVSPVDMSTRWNSRPDVSGGGVLIDNGTHSVDIIRYLLGPISEVLAVTEASSGNLRVEDNAYLFINTASGVRAHVDLSWSFDKQHNNYISLYGTAGTAHVGWRESKYKQHNSSNWLVFGPGYDKLQAFRNNVRNFCAAIDGTELPLINLSDAIASVDVIAAAYASARKGGWVKVAPSNVEPRPTADATIMEAAQ
jgi:predicted dehydrogenase